MEAGKLTHADRDVVIKAVDIFETTVREELATVDKTLSALRTEPGLEVFAMSDSYLELSVEMSFSLDLQAFDQATAELVFCEKDSDLQPWDKNGNRIVELSELYDPIGLWVYGDFDMEWPVRPSGWPDNPT